MITAKVRNKDRLFARLKRTAPALGLEVGAESLKAANEMAALARSFVAVDQGDTRDSITVTPGGQMTPLYSHPGGSKVVPEHAAMVTAGNSKARTPHLLEYGARAHINAGRFAGTVNPGSPAQPFFWPAYRMIRRPMRSRTGRAIRRAIKKAMGT